MSDGLSRRQVIALTTGVVATAGVGGAAPVGAERAANADLEALSSRSGVYTPARGNGVMQFGFDFPEPSVKIGALLFGFRIQTFENVYAIDAELTRVTRAEGTVRVVCGGLLSCGGQVKAPGTLIAEFTGAEMGVLEWRVRAEAGSAIKSITTVVRGLPRGT